MAPEEGRRAPSGGAPRDRARGFVVHARSAAGDIEFDPLAWRPPARAARRRRPRGAAQGQPWRSAKNAALSEQTCSARRAVQNSSSERKVFFPVLPSMQEIE